METVTSLGVILALAFLTESLTEYFFGETLLGVRARAALLKYLAAGVGVALAIAYQLDLPHDLFGVAPRLPLVGEILTGLLLGRGANYVHDFAALALTRGSVTGRP